jgi:hypothetical protein
MIIDKIPKNSIIKVQIIKERYIMNKERRQQLSRWIRDIELKKTELERILSDEENYFDMMPENLQGSTNGMNSEEAIDKINDAVACIEEAIEVIEEII